ncbi:MAG: type IV pilus twitching motility protein PilT [Rubrobacter sp.]|jgi:twitching motility protein PilT|nr:type IV pilus twitching motility protein PilT [Rubrobacter sp.]
MIEIGLNDYLFEALDRGASDLHLTAEAPPSLRIHGEIVATNNPPLTPSDTRELIYGILTDMQRKRLEENLELDFSYTLPKISRFRVNIYFQKNALGAAFRMIPHEIQGLHELGLPKIVEELTEKPRGLFLVTGPTGSGKSTTLAAMIDRINENRREHIMSVEDPIEFIHTHKRCIVNQREVGQDTKGFANALKHVLRQDPDVILVGEMRDLETVSLAITAAETGHMVFATLHTQDALQTIDRVIDVFPPHQQQQVRTQLANAIQGVITQTLIPKRGGEGRAVSCEVLIATPGVRNLIREGKNHQLYSAMQTGGKFGMQTMDASLVDLMRRGVVSREEAEKRSSNPDELKRLMGGSTASSSSHGNGAKRSSLSSVPTTKRR